MFIGNVLLSQVFPHVLDPPPAAHMGNLTKYNVGRWLENDLEEGPDGMHKEKAPDIV